MGEFCVLSALFFILSFSLPQLYFSCRSSNVALRFSKFKFLLLVSKNDSFFAISKIPFRFFRGSFHFLRFSLSVGHGLSVGGCGSLSV